MKTSILPKIILLELYENLFCESFVYAVALPGQVFVYFIIVSESEYYLDVIHFII